MTTADAILKHPLWELSRGCDACELREKCNGAVPSEGDIRAKLMFVGEAPGRNEDVKARPFIGSAGEELENYLWNILGMRRRDVFLSNICLCRPSGSDVKKDWAPNGDNIEICTRLWLEPTLELVKPKIVGALGAVATRYFFPDEKITMDAVNGMPRLVKRGWGEFIVVPVYHPAAGLHEPRTMNAIQFGFRMVRDALDGVWVEVVDEYPEPEYEVN